LQNYTLEETIKNATPPKFFCERQRIAVEELENVQRLTVEHQLSYPWKKG
jgi:hypothetical protein